MQNSCSRCYKNYPAQKGKKNYGCHLIISLFTNMSIFFTKESRPPGVQGLNHAANLYFKTFMLLWGFDGRQKKGKED